MKLLIYTLAFNNADLLDKCVSSWPKNVDKAILWQGNKGEIESIFNKHKDDCVFTIKKINNYGYSGGNNIVFMEAFEKRNYDAVICVGSDTEMLNGFFDNFVVSLEDFNFVESTHQFNCFYIDKVGQKKVGLFDENIYPAYCDDDDFRIRVVKSGIKYKINHGIHNLFAHVGSAAVKSLSEIEKFRAYKSFQANKGYMFKKWRAKQDSIPKWKPVYETPFNDPNWPLDKWVLEPEGRKKRLWDNIVWDNEDERLVPLLRCLNGKGTYDYNTKEI